ncbi:hypothetical protein F4678DRAFT_416923 [Xylaria arbuscula]|nr:hypothetical protein F4678DRAFT_416923 [Xylaria arbuscula]
MSFLNNTVPLSSNTSVDEAPLQPVLRALFEEAKGVIVEYTASAFWQVLLQRAFSDDPNYIVVCEHSPDGTRRRIDIVVKRYDPVNDNITAMVFVEAKSEKGSLKEVESQALDAAVRAIRHQNYKAVYAMTTQGLHFRFWIVNDEHARELEPLHGPAYVPADADQYVYIDTKDGFDEFMENISVIKDQPPIMAHITLASQAHLYPQYQYNSMQVDTHQAEAGPSDVDSYQHNLMQTDTYQAGAGPSGAGPWVHEQQHNSMQTDTHQAGAGPSDVDLYQHNLMQTDTYQAGAGPSGAGPWVHEQQHNLMQTDTHQAEAESSGQSLRLPASQETLPANVSTGQASEHNPTQVDTRQAEAGPSDYESQKQLWLKVDVYKEHHKYCFKTGGGKMMKTSKKDWSETTYKKKTVYYYNDQGVNYYTRTKPGA